jgi:hypothetical protein
MTSPDLRQVHCLLKRRSSNGVSKSVLISVTLRLFLGIFFWRLLISPDQKPFGGAQKSPITFIRDLMQKVGLGGFFLLKSQSAISDGAGVAHGISSNATEPGLKCGAGGSFPLNRLVRTGSEAPRR